METFLVFLNHCGVLLLLLLVYNPYSNQFRLLLQKHHSFQLRPMMKASFQNVLYTGPLGTAMIPKVFSNLLCAVNIIAAGEAMMVAKKSGLDMKTFWDAVRSSSGNSFVWETGGPMVMQGTYDPSFDIALHCKDNQLCFDIARKNKVYNLVSSSFITFAFILWPILEFPITV